MTAVGQVRLNGGHWHVTAPPHVVVRLKRVFERISKGEHGTVTLSDTPENARELRWFADRYELDFEPRDYLDRQANAHLERERQIAMVLAPDYTPPEFNLALPPRDYQRIAADLTLRAGALLLGDDVGLGKTVSGLAVLTAPGTLPALVVTMTHLPRQWEKEINRFCPGLRVHILRSGKPYDIRATREMKGRFPDVIIANYHKLSGWADHLAAVPMRTVIFDEAQELRIPSSYKYRAALHIARAASYRLELTATPVYNYGSEIHSVLSVIAPGALGSVEEFRREWCTCGGEIVDDPAALGHHLRAEGLMLRRTRKDVGRELPAGDAQIITHTVDADPEALDSVSDSLAELARIILAQGGTARGEKLRASEELSWRLRQATGIAKAPYVAAFVRMLVESGEKVVLYGWHREVYDIWRDRLKDLNPVFYTGTESPAQKDASKRAFCEGRSKVLIISLRAGAGLDGLQYACRTVVIGEPDWSPKVHHQGIGRVARDGQTDKVFAYFLMAESGSDPVIADVLGLKDMQATGITDPDAPLVEEFQIDENRIKRLAAGFLAQRGLPVPPPPPPEPVAVEAAA